MNDATATPAALAAGSTREQILGVARSLIETRSYLGFSFQDVADAVGIRKASLYHHFPTKEALGIAVIRQATQLFKDWDAARVRTPKDALESYFRMYRDTLKAGSGMCPAGALTPGWDCIDKELRRPCRNCATRRCCGSPACWARWRRPGRRRVHRLHRRRPMCLRCARARCSHRA